MVYHKKYYNYYISRVRYEDAAKELNMWGQGWPTLVKTQKHTEYSNQMEEHKAELLEETILFVRRATDLYWRAKQHKEVL